MSPIQVPSTTRQSSRIKVLPRPDYKRQLGSSNRNPKQRGGYRVYDIYDRDSADPDWYVVKWFGYKDDCYDSTLPRSQLEKWNFGSDCDFVDGFKKWEKRGLKKGKVRTFKEYRKKHTVCTFYF